MEALVLPPLLAGQFRVWRRGSTPVACAAWALLDAAGEARLLSGEGRLAPGEWQAGDRLWLVYLLAPYGGRERFLRELRRSVFEGKDVRVLGGTGHSRAASGRWATYAAECGSRPRRPVRPPGRLVDSTVHP